MAKVLTRLAWLTLIARVFWALATAVGGFGAGGALFRFLGAPASSAVATAGMVGAVVRLVGSSLSALGLWAFAQLLELMLSIERSTRRTALATEDAAPAANH